MRSARLDRKGIRAAQLEGVGEPGRRDLAESRRPFGGKTGSSKWLTQEAITRAVVV